MPRQERLDFNLESLEAKRMMAGDVSVRATAAGDLLVIGDNESNEIVIESTGLGAYQITGANGTRINGQPSIRVTAVTDDVRINLRNGDNRLHLDEIFVRDDMQVRTGSGADKILLLGGSVQDDLDIRSGRGHDEVFLQAASVGDRLNLRTDQGRDGVALEQMVIGGRSIISLGSDNDDLLVRGSETVARMVANLGSGADSAYFDRATGEQLVIGGGGQDAFYSDETAVQRQLEATATAVSMTYARAPALHQFDIDVDVSGPNETATAVASVESGQLKMETSLDDFSYEITRGPGAFRGRSVRINHTSAADYRIAVDAP